MRSVAAGCCTLYLFFGNARLGTPASSSMFEASRGTTGINFTLFGVLLQLGFVFKRRSLSPNRFFACCATSNRDVQDLAEARLAQSHQVDSDGELDSSRNHRCVGTWLHLLDASQLVRVVSVQSVLRQVCVELTCDQ
ncbi:uncharacterized protein LOC120414942 [Culex pipiens pallens]|uniref:uncharacterized protein LOC120414942 n=1 Tax=Culex pipiens pallens TaxID=42434 RepID=UPI001953B237|nr:uncharacterized protein LOC120414942 [Culex pipiens pallens]